MLMVLGPSLITIAKLRFQSISVAERIDLMKMVKMN
jgi:hypothetical protein